MDIKIIEEAIKELWQKDNLSLYKKIRRWAREHIKKAVVAPNDSINWPKGCLLVGLMHQALKRLKSDMPEQKNTAIKCISAVRKYFDKWIKSGANIYTIDDCLAGEALLLLANTYESESTERFLYLSMADKMMHFLFDHDKDLEGSLPYRPAHKNGRIFADGVGMVTPFAIHYGIIREETEAIKLGLKQMANFMTYGLDNKTKLPYHAYSLSSSGVDVNTFGDIGWGRATGWISYGIEETLYVLSLYEGERAIIGEEYDEINAMKEKFIDTVKVYRRSNNLFGSSLLDDSSPIDTSASAMITYMLNNCSSDSDIKEAMSEYITDEGKVIQAQGECLDLGVYSNIYDSYPWSVGMLLLLFSKL